VDSGLQQLAGCNQKPIPLEGDFYGSKDKPTRIYLGEASTDEEGRLVVLAGHGKSKSIVKEDDAYPYILTDFDSPDWIDDTSDGWISVTIKPLASPETSYVFFLFNYVKVTMLKIIQIAGTGEGSSCWNDTQIRQWNVRAHVFIRSHGGDVREGETYKAGE
jgi:hypothetical protein